MDGDALRQCLVQFKPGTAHMPVRGDQTHRAIATLFDPMGRFDGVGTGVDCLVSQSDAAIEQFFRRVIGYGPFLWPNIADDARYQHGFFRPVLQQNQATDNASRSARTTDRRVGEERVMEDRSMWSP